MVKFQHSNEGTVKSTGIGSAEGFSHQGGYGDGIPIAAILIMGDRSPVAASLPWVEQDGAKPLPMLPFACSEAKERVEPMTRRAERCEESGYAPVPRHAGAGEMTILFEHSIPHANGRTLGRL